jgi:hypothetical protein
MTSKNTYTIAINVHEDYANTDKDIHYSTVAIVEAETMSEAETKLLEWFEKSDIPNHVTHKVEIVKTLPKIH